MQISGKGCRPWAATAVLRATAASPRPAGGQFLPTPGCCGAWRAVDKTKTPKVTAWAEGKGPSKVAGHEGIGQSNGGTRGLRLFHERTRDSLGKLQKYFVGAFLLGGCADGWRFRVILQVLGEIPILYISVLPQAPCQSSAQSPWRLLPAPAPHRVPRTPPSSSLSCFPCSEFRSPFHLLPATLLPQSSHCLPSRWLFQQQMLTSFNVHWNRPGRFDNAGSKQLPSGSPI